METSKEITSLLLSHIKGQKNNAADILDALHILLNGNSIKYDFNNGRTETFSNKIISDESLHKLLFTFNEKTAKRKIFGVYYTASDVVDYILSNTLIMNLRPELQATYKKEDAETLLFQLDEKTYKSLLFKKIFIDPTCGSGEFLIKAID